jgi:hypothetical protein
MSYSWSTFTITTSTYTVANTFAYDCYYVDTSVSNTAITITLPTTSGNGGSSVLFISVTSIEGGDTANNAVTIQTSSTSTQSIITTGVSQTNLVKNGYLQLRAQDNGSTGLWTVPAQNPTVSGNFGDGMDGTVTATTSTLTNDMYYQNLIVPTGVTLNTAMFRVFVNGLLTMQGTGTISCTGNAGGTGASGAGGAGATALAAGSLGSGSGGAGSAGGTNSANGAPGTATSNMVGNQGGTGGNAAARTGALPGTATFLPATSGGTGAFSSRPLKNIVNATNGRSPGNTVWNFGNGGGGGAGGAANSGGGGGGGGGGYVYLAARFIVVTGTGSAISANGGNGGAAGGTEGGGGGGGGGGAVVIITQTPNLTSNFTGLTVSANGGAGGAGVGGGLAGTAGSAGPTAILGS